MILAKQILNVDLYFWPHMCAILGEGTPNAAVAYNGIEERVFVNQLFLDLPKEKQEPIIAHEIGHLVYQHVQEKMIKGLHGRDIRQEYEADEFACRIVGPRRVYHMLIDTRDAMMKQGRHREGLIDLTRRIDNIGKML